MQNDRTREDHQIQVSDWIGDITPPTDEQSLNLSNAFYTISELGVFGDLSIDGDWAWIIAHIVQKVKTEGFPKDLRV